ncbi:SDR family NAD(P)-dependent oxidoreductase [Paenibacillus glycanilyticus]|uniref:Short-chain dehydrogenase n=1 Tax=Paenibacillus glycanilyticus TaxID=126569 RepID=A0ABQ6GCS4_9BACL|nr:SDR family NAD(P)-dependent oxidoreductase [Paenibacillus glycanilyticus]GLX68734.1 short-chain dehydrogenase [Paenibacillus glycanilyticus]
MKTIAIVGAGPGLGLSVAKKFGQNGFRVAAISRNPEKLALIVQELAELQIEAQSFVADIADPAALKQALQAAKEALGPIDVLEFSPYAGWHTFTPVLDTTPESVAEQMNGYLLPAVQSVNEVLPEMIERGSGAILFTTGLSAMFPIPFVGNGGIIMSGVRNYAANLHNVLKEKGVYVGHLSIGTMIKAGTPGDPGILADAWYNLYETADHFEEVFPPGVDPNKLG